ncbi:MAG: hypothetical protein OEM96_11340 [Gemmatimonadota bacterium]|nr:hypothetical protein [Gemmatimonadota bacterium]
MPSDDSLVDRALGVMHEPAEAFHSALARAIEELRAFVSRHRIPTGDPGQLAALELGAFGEGRVDPTRFAELSTRPAAVESRDLHHVERALETLIAAEAKGTDLLRARVPRGGSLRDVVSQALAETGRVFGVIRRIAPVLDGGGEVIDGGSLPHGYPFALWSRAERAAAPPLFVEVDGADLNVAGLSEFLDGSQKIVLMVQGSAPPAPLAQLLSPRVLVMQTADPTALARVAAMNGPAVVALGTDGLVPFVHDPAAGRCYAERISVQDLPSAEDLPRGDFRQAEDVEHLRELATAGSPPSNAAGAPRIAPAQEIHADSVDRLAGWLLEQAQFSSSSAQN